MAKSAEEKAKEAEAAKKAAEEKAAAEKKAAEEAEAAKKAAEEGDGDKGKKDRTFTEAEVKAREKAAAEKAAADAKKKFEEEKDLEENERLKKELEERRNASRMRDAKDAGVEALKKAGARSPELLWKTIQSDIDFDEKGGIKNLDTLVTGLKDEYADQFGETKPVDGIDAGKGKPSGEGLTREKLEKMTPAEINELDWADVSKVMAAG